MEESSSASVVLLPVEAEELQNVLSCAFQTINGRRTQDFQSPQVLMLLTEFYFYEICRALVSELSAIEEDSTLREIEILLTGHQDNDLPLFRQLALARDYELHSGVNVDGWPDEAVNSFDFRKAFLYELGLDVIRARVVSGRVVLTNVDLSFDTQSAALRHVGPALQMIANNLGGISLERTPPSAAEQGKTSIGLGSTLSAIHPLLTEQNFKTLETAIAGIDKSKKHMNLLSDAGKLPCQAGPVPQSIQALVDGFNREYAWRRQVFLRRLDVVTQAFLWSPKTPKKSAEVSAILESTAEWKSSAAQANVYYWDVLAADRSLLNFDKVSGGGHTVKSALKTVTIGQVPNRGGVPEGYSALEVRGDVKKANIQLQQKDANEAAMKRRAVADAEGKSPGGFVRGGAGGGGGFGGDGHSGRGAWGGRGRGAWQRGGGRPQDVERFQRGGGDTYESGGRFTGSSQGYDSGGGRFGGGGGGGEGGGFTRGSGGFRGRYESGGNYDRGRQQYGAGDHGYEQQYHNGGSGWGGGQHNEREAWQHTNQNEGGGGRGRGRGRGGGGGWGGRRADHPSTASWAWRGR